MTEQLTLTLINVIVQYLSLSDRLPSVGPSILLQMAFFHSFSWLSNIPSRIHTTSLSFPLLMDNVEVSTPWLLSVIRIMKF